MTRMHHLLTLASGRLAVALGLAALVPLAYAINYGREVSQNELVTTTVDDTDDSDDFVFDAASGWKVTALVKRLKGSTATPKLELIDPDGNVQMTGKIGKPATKVVAVLDEGGRWGFRVGSTEGSGTCSLKWSVKPSKIAPVKKQPIGANTNTNFTFPGTGGALVSWTLSFKGDGGAQVVKLLDPDGAEIEINEDLVTRKLTGEKAVNIPLVGPGGTYTLVVRNDFAPVTLNLAIKVAMPKLEKTAPVLNASEPILDSVDIVGGGCGTRVTLTGANLDTNGTVRFGANAGTGIAVEQGGASAAITVPSGTGLVDIVWTNADGQVAVLPEAFTFEPVHTVTSFDPTTGPQAGGQSVVITGTGFRTGVDGLYTVRFGNVDAPSNSVEVLDATTIRCNTPANVAGGVVVRVTDDCGQVANSPGQYTYGGQMFITFVTPNAAPTFGGIPCIISGNGFNTTDTVLLDGVPVTTTPVFFNSAVVGHRIDALPSHASGKVDVTVNAVLGQTTTKTDAIAYYDFTDITATAIPASSATDDWGGNSAAVIDKDNNGVADFLAISHTSGLGSGRPGTRILTNNGSGVFTDVTATKMPPAVGAEDFGANKVLATKIDSDLIPDLYLSRPGTGDEPTLSPDKARIVPWGRILYADSNANMQSAATTGSDIRFIISGTLIYNGGINQNRCYLYNFDFRSTSAAVGDLDSDGDTDVVLVNNVSIKSFIGVNCAFVWVTCTGYNPSCYTFTTYNFGRALRLLTAGAAGGLTDKTEALIETAPTTNEDFRGITALVADIAGDTKNDVIISHDSSVNGGSAIRVFERKNQVAPVQYRRATNIMPTPANGDDWRSHALAVADYNRDFLPDLVASWNGAPVGASPFATRIFLKNAQSAQLEDRTSELLSGVLPAGDDGRARSILAIDLDKDLDPDLILSTPDSVGSGNRRTRYLLNIGIDEESLLPVFIDASQLFPAEASDNGAAMHVIAVDIDGDADLDLIVTDSYQANANGRRTRVWRQNR